MFVINGRYITGVIFDIDGTLVDSFSTLYTVFNQGLRDFGLKPVPIEFLIRSFKKHLTLGETLREVSSPPLPESVMERCREKILELYRSAETESVRPFPGTLELFKSLKEWGGKIGIATGRTSKPEMEWARFRRYGLDGYIDALVTSAEVGSRKPAPDAILTCAERLNVPIAHCVVVGDTEFDIVAAKRAGAIAVVIATGQESADLLSQANPDLIFENLAVFASYLNTQREAVPGTPEGTPSGNSP
jgi:HAD superfamily hydrolase (TIGR01509 family)